MSWRRDRLGRYPGRTLAAVSCALALLAAHPLVRGGEVGAVRAAALDQPVTVQASGEAPEEAGRALPPDQRCMGARGGAARGIGGGGRTWPGRGAEALRPARRWGAGGAWGRGGEDPAMILAVAHLTRMLAAHLGVGTAPVGTLGANPALAVLQEAWFDAGEVAPLRPDGGRHDWGETPQPCERRFAIGHHLLAPPVA